MTKLFQAVCENHNMQGYGVVRKDKLVIFVRGLLKGEEARVRIVSYHKRYALGEIAELLKVFKERVKPTCPYYSLCGGCALSHMRYDAQTETKQEELKTLFTKNGLKVDWLPLVVGEHQYHYRSKAQLHMSNKSLCYYEDQSHEPVAIEGCCLLSPSVNQLIQEINQVLKTHPQSGEALIRESSDCKEIVVCIKSLSDNWQEGYLQLLKKVPSLKGMKVECGDEVFVYGEPVLNEPFLDTAIALQPETFIQVNPQVRRLLYQQVLDFGVFHRSDTVLDLYGGFGPISLLLCDQVKSCLVGEIAESSVLDGQRFCERRKIDNVTYLQEDCAKVLSAHKADVVIVDPPRNGLSSDVRRLLCSNPAKQLIYISCDPHTLVRDLRQLQSVYQLKKAVGVDLFPQTRHVECVVAMEQK